MRKPHHIEMDSEADSYQPPAGYGCYRNVGTPGSLWLPSTLITKIRAEAAASREIAAQEANEAVNKPPSPATMPPAPAREETDAPMHPVFDPAQLDVVTESLQGGDSDKNAKLLVTLESAGRDDGYRLALPGKIGLEQLKADLAVLAEEMPNFADAIDVLATELALALSGPLAEFRVTPVLLYGAPGIGKTRFASRLAEILSVGFEKVSMGSTSGAFELAGVSQGWGTTRPGRISRLLAEGEDASPVVLLDELDKMGGDERFPVLPVLLDLLEPDSSLQFRDECLEVKLDASRIVFLATANEAERVAAPLASRIRMIEVSAPTADQRSQITDRLLLAYQTRHGVAFGAGVLDRLVESAMDLRQLQQVLRQAVGRALMQNRDVHANDLTLPERVGARIGFL